MLIKPQNISGIINNYASMSAYEQQYEKAKLERLLDEYLDSLGIPFTQTSKQSVTKRIMHTIEDGNFYTALHSNYNSVNLLNTGFSSYNNYLCAEPKLYLFTFRKNNTAYSLYLGLNNEDLIVKTATIKKHNTAIDASIANYAYADHTRLKRKTTFGNNLKNSTELDRFDPIKLSSSDPHENKLDFITDDKERGFYAKYFFKDPPCPHFHVFPVKLMATKPYSNTRSLAIALPDLKRYIRDLDQTNDKNSPLLNYDLSMPYLMIKNNEISVSIDPFLSHVEKLLDRYSRTNNKNVVIDELYDLLYIAKQEHKSVGASKKTTLNDIYNAISIIDVATKYLPISDQIRLVNSYDDCIYYSNTLENTNFVSSERIH